MSRTSPDYLEGRFTVLEARFLEVGVITAKKEALQTLCIPKNLNWNTLSLYFKEIVK